MKQALLDTDTISYYFRNYKTVAQKVDQYIASNGFVNFSVVTYYELLSGLYYKDAKVQLEKAKLFLNANNIIALNSSTADRAAEIFAKLRKSGVTIGHRDVMIAACAIENEMTLVTNNTKHFKHIDKLEVDNWMLND